MPSQSSPPKQEQQEEETDTSLFLSPQFVGSVQGALASLGMFAAQVLIAKQINGPKIG